jgi:hypothetical protein
MADGVTERPDGSVTIQLARRSDQLEGIAQFFREAIEGGWDLGYSKTDEPALYRRMLGYCDQLEIIADELKKGKKSPQ